MSDSDFDLGMYTIYDVKAESYSQPFFSPNNATAERDFLSAAEDPKTNIGRHPQDFALFRCGGFYFKSGRVTPCLPTEIFSGSGVPMEAPIHISETEAIRSMAEYSVGPNENGVIDRG